MMFNGNNIHFAEVADVNKTTPLIVGVVNSEIQCSDFMNKTPAMAIDIGVNTGLHH